MAKRDPTQFYLRHKSTDEAPWTVVTVPKARFNDDVMNLVDHCRERMHGPIGLDPAEDRRLSSILAERDKRR